MSAILAFLPLFARLRGALLASLLASLVTLAAGIGLLGLSGWFLTAAALSTAGAAFNLFGPSAGVRGLSFLRILSRYGEKVSGHEATLKLLSDLRRWLFARLFPLAPLGRRFGRGDLVSRLLADVEALDTLFLVALGPISTAVIAGLGMTVLLALLLPQAAPVYAASFLAAAIVVPAVLIAASRRYAEAAAIAASALRSTVLDGIEGHQDLVLFGATDAAAARVTGAAARLGRLRAGLGRNGALAAASVQGLMAVALLGTLATGLEAYAAGGLDAPLLVGLLLAVIASFEASALLVRSATRLAGAAAAAERLRDIDLMAPAVSDPPRPGILPAGTVLTLKDLTFGHDLLRPVFSGLDLEVQPGELVAITGPSGSGKSSLAQLLVRLADPISGSIRIGGVDIRQLPLAALRQRIVLMTQDAPVFRDTIRANLLIGRPEAQEEDLWAMLEATGLAGFIRGLPDGLDAYAGEAGRTLSAGQARRLCLARTLLSEAPVIILDEPTSGLDREAEAAFLAQLPTLLAGRTGIVITHADVPPGFGRVLELKGGTLLQRAA